MSVLSDRVLRAGTVFLGPAAQTFFERQTRLHMAGLPFNVLDTRHLPELARWIEISAALLIGDAKAKLLAQQVRAM
jgi:hypothetical protein